jgi:hypothetical protein
MVCLNLPDVQRQGAYDLRWQGENTHSVDVVWGNVGATHRSLAVT